MMRSHSALAFTVLKTLPPNTRSQSASSLTAFMKASVTSTETLNMRSRAGIALGVDEGLDVGMIAAQRRHHGAAARARAHDGAAHRVPHIHERQRPRGVGADALHRRALRPQGREIVPDAAALLHGERRLAQVLEDADMSSGIVPMTKQLNSVTLRPVPAPAMTRPAGRNLKPDKRLVEAPGPQLGIALRRRQRPRHAPPRGVQVGIGLPGGVAKAVFHVPDALGNRRPFHRQK